METETEMTDLDEVNFTPKVNDYVRLPEVIIEIFQQMLVYFPTQGVKLEPHFQEISEEHVSYKLKSILYFTEVLFFIFRIIFIVLLQNDPLLEIKKEPYLESDLIDIKPHAGAAIHVRSDIYLNDWDEIQLDNERFDYCKQVSGEIEMDYTKMKIKTDGLQYDADIEDGVSTRVIFRRNASEVCHLG